VHTHEANIDCTLPSPPESLPLPDPGGNRDEQQDDPMEQAEHTHEANIDCTCDWYLVLSRVVGGGRGLPHPMPTGKQRCQTQSDITTWSALEHDSIVIVIVIVAHAICIETNHKNTWCRVSHTHTRILDIAWTKRQHGTK